jgi:hypothetical protein
VDIIIVVLLHKLFVSEVNEDLKENQERMGFKEKEDLKG